MSEAVETTTPPTEGAAPATGNTTLTGDATPATETANPTDQAETATEGNAEGETQSEQEGKEKDKLSAPETYKFTPPEGMEVDSDALKSFEDMARENGLSQEQFSKVTQHGLDYFQKMLGQQAEQFAAREQGWQDEALKDRDISDGKALKPEVMANVGHVFDQFGGNDLRKALVETGAGNHPEIIRAFNAIGKALGAAQTPDKGKPASELKGNSFEDIARRRYASN